MVQKVHPSFDRDVQNRELAAAIQYAGGSAGWISQTGNRLVEDSEGDLSSGDLGTFDFENSSGTTVTIGAGEAVVEGAYMATDETFDVDLAASTANQTVYIGWRDGLTDTIIVGLDSAFSTDDHRIPAWEFDTEAGTIAATRDVRDLGQTLSVEALEASGSLSGPTASEGDVVTLPDNPDTIPVFFDAQTGEPLYPDLEETV